MPHWAWALGICAAAAGLEGLCAGRDSAGVLKSLRQPPWALPFPGWVAIGLAYYAICFFSLWRLLAAPEASACVALLVAVMIANAAWNYFFFRRRDFRVSFWYQAPYAVLAIAFLLCALQVDRTVALAIAAYFLYWPYAVAWTYRVWKLNATND